MDKHEKSKTGSVIRSALVVAGWLSAAAGWIVPAKYLIAKIAFLSVARVLP